MSGAGRLGTVRRTRGGVYRVALDDGEAVEASLRKRLKRERRTGDQVVIGDRVRVADAGDGAYTVEEVLPRENEIVRRAPGGRKAKVVAANLDRLLAVMSVRDPEPSRRLVDRLLVIAEASGVEGVLVINKVDLDGGADAARELAAPYREVGYRVLATSAGSGAGLDDLREILCRGASALVGPSGVGKSSLLNALEPSLDLRTGEISAKPRRGRHTTVTARLLELKCGGVVADTPGFGDVGLWGVEPEALDRCFPEFRPLLEHCRFRRCSHVHEPSCGVREAVEEGRIDADRYESYRLLREEAEETTRPEWER